MKVIDLWLKVCSLTGEGYNHSMFEVFLERKIGFCEFASASQMIQANIVTARNEMRDPNDEMIFHEVKASG
jgi:hypothetical protein